MDKQILTLWIVLTNLSKKEAEKRKGKERKGNEGKEGRRTRKEGIKAKRKKEKIDYKTVKNMTSLEMYIFMATDRLAISRI